MQVMTAWLSTQLSRCAPGSAAEAIIGKNELLPKRGKQEHQAYSSSSKTSTIGTNALPTSTQIVKAQRPTSNPPVAQENLEKRNLSPSVALLNPEHPLSYLNQYDSDMIPSSFQHEMTSSYKQSLKTDRVTFAANVRAKPNDAAARYKLAKCCLLSAEVVKDFRLKATDQTKIEYFAKEEKSFIEVAKRQIPCIEDNNVFDARRYYLESQILDYQGINCKDIEKVERYVWLLKLSHLLKPTSKGIKQRLDITLDYLEKRWNILKAKGEVDETTHKQWLARIEQANPLKNLFLYNPNFFKLANDPQHATFFSQHPECKSVEAFVKAHPEVEIVDLTLDEGGDLAVDNLPALLEKAKTSPFIRKMAILSLKPTLTPSIATQIEQVMVQKPSLIAYFGNIKDVDTLKKAFEKDENFNPLKSLKISESLTANSKQIFIATISSDSAKIQTQATENQSTSRIINVSNFDPQTDDFIISCVESDGTTSIYASEESALKLAHGKSKILDKENKPVIYSTINVIPKELMENFRETARKFISEKK